MKIFLVLLSFTGIMSFDVAAMDPNRLQQRSIRNAFRQEQAIKQEQMRRMEMERDRFRQRAVELEAENQSLRCSHDSYQRQMQQTQAENIQLKQVMEMERDRFRQRIEIMEQNQEQQLQYIIERERDRFRQYMETSERRASELEAEKYALKNTVQIMELNQAEIRQQYLQQLQSRTQKQQESMQKEYCKLLQKVQLMEEEHAKIQQTPELKEKRDTFIKQIYFFFQDQHHLQSEKERTSRQLNECSQNLQDCLAELREHLNALNKLKHAHALILQEVERNILRQRSEFSQQIEILHEQFLKQVAACTKMQQSRSEESNTLEELEKAEKFQTEAQLKRDILLLKSQIEDEKEKALQASNRFFVLSFFTLLTPKKQSIEIQTE